MTDTTTAAPAADPTISQERQVTSGATVWLTGLPSAGKTTIACELAGRLREEGHRVEVLDGDAVHAPLAERGPV
jgi:adenylylsulfate kinase